MLSRSIRDIESRCYLSNAKTTIFEHNFFHFFDVIVVNRGGWTTCMRQVFYDLKTLTECFMPLKYLRLDRIDSPKHFCNIFSDSVAVILLKIQNFKQTRCSIFFFHGKNCQTNFWRSKPMTAKYILMDVSRSNFT